MLLAKEKKNLQIIPAQVLLIFLLIPTSMSMMESVRESERERERERNRERETDREREIERQTETERERERERGGRGNNSGFFGIQEGMRKMRREKRTNILPLFRSCLSQPCTKF